MDKPTELTVQANGQPITDNTVPMPDADLKRTMKWLSGVDTNLLGVDDVATHNNSQVLVSLLQSMEKRQIDQAEQIRKILDILEKEDETNLPSSIGGSRRSSVGSCRSSTDQPAPAGGAEALAEEDQHAHTFDAIIENRDVLDDVFERFILGSNYTTLVKRSEHIQASSATFLEVARDQLGVYLSKTLAQAIIAKLSSLDKG